MKKEPSSRLALRAIHASLGLLAVIALASPAAHAKPAHSLTMGEGFVNPLGFHDPSPALSWKLPDGVKRQTAYRMEIKSGATRWDGGWVESSQSVFVPHAGKPLMSRQRGEWRVRFRAENGRDSGWSDYARFEMGLLSNDDWTARWIRPQLGDNAVTRTREPVAWLRRQFAVSPKAISQARLYVTARGLFHVFLNGKAVGRDYFANGWTSYKHRIDTLTYDVTEQLRRGENNISAMLGAGWYAGRVGWRLKKQDPTAIPELLLQLEITYKDGTTATVASDGGWEGTYEGPLVSSAIYDGEIYDARRANSGWSPVVVNPDIGPARLTPKPFAPVRVTQTLPVQAITEPEPGRFVFDLGQNMVGWPRLNISVEKDRAITIRFAEMLNKDGTLYTANYRSAKSSAVYIPAKDGSVEWEPAFTFFGFRYLELSGLPPGAKPDKSWVTGMVLHSDLRPIGSFSSSHAKLNQLQSNIVWGQRGNFLDIPTDCPQRDERHGWLGDALVFCPTSMFNYDCHAFWKSWLGSMRDQQYADGRLPCVIPDMRGPGRSSPGWNDAAVFIPWDVYVRTGDLSMLAENYPMMEKLAAWYRTKCVDGLSAKTTGYGDWLQPYSKNNIRDGNTSKDYLAAAYFARDLQILADSARLLGRADDEKRHAAELVTLKKAFVKKYFDADGRLQGITETQTAYLLAIDFALIPADMVKKAAAHLERLIVDEAQGHLRTGFLGTPLIAGVLDRTGRAGLAVELLFKETYPSWFYPINQGATTMWERWNSYTHAEGFGDASMNSFNHYAYGAIGQWMYERIAGLAPDPAHPGYKHFFVRPLPAAPLDHARAELDTPYGKAVSGWIRKNGKLHMEVIVPPNTTATIEFPSDRKPETVEAGTHRYEVEL